MAATLAMTLNLQVQALYNNSVGMAGAVGSVQKSLVASLASGVGANQGDKIFTELAKAISGNYDVDLSGSLTDVYGTVISFARIKGFAIFRDQYSADSGNVIMGGAAATQWVGPFGAAAHTIAVKNGGAMIYYAPDAAGWPVVGGASDLLRFAPSAGTQNFDWMIWGASA